MATTNYYSIDGMLIGEETSGVMRNYGTDALGSVVETVLNGVEENTYQYKPYGGVLAKTGTAADPSFLWNGGSGYRATKLTNSEFYVRARVVSSTTAQWTTVDPMWPNELAYGYSKSNPATLSDPSGLATLGFTTLHKDTTCACGPQPKIPTREIQWTLKDLRPNELNGYIVQLVSTTLFQFSCQTPTSFSSGNQYFEAWQVVNGVIYQGYSKHKVTPGVDTNTNGAFVVHKCESNKWVVNYDAQYIVIPGGLNWNQTGGTNGPLPTWRPLPFSYPDWWFTDAVSNTVSRTMSVLIYCCSGCVPGYKDTCSVTYEKGA